MATRRLATLVLCAALAGCGTTSSGHRADPPAASPTTASTGPSPSPAPTPTATTHHLPSAGAIIADPAARLEAYSAVPGHPRRRISEWYLCRDRHCYHRTYALAVSGDGFRTLHVVGVGASRVANGWYLEPAGPDHFAISPNGGRRSLVDLAGHVTPIEVSGPAGPVAAREVAVPGSKGHWLAVDPDTGKAHPLSVPAGVEEVRTTPSGQLRALTLGHPRYFWSADGGAAWHEIALPHLDPGQWAELVPTTSDALHVLVVGGENTVFPWERVLRSDGRTWTSYDGPSDPTGYIDTSVALPDGRLLMDVGGWSDQRGSRPSVNPLGLWGGPDWAHPQPLPQGAPFAGRGVGRPEPLVVDTVLTPGSVTIYAQTPARTGVVSSADGGETWRPVRSR
ncbi:hypothetical protein [Nocardioides cynanchi]|uniref:hypothetical protein n=1 Tax=Nocardioides cynanchi TaxID=2558918 RepID=UPI00124647B8|nr:hypothetical protein [Nocardioides cynanchi]